MCIIIRQLNAGRTLSNVEPTDDFMIMVFTVTMAITMTVIGRQNYSRMCSEACVSSIAKQFKVDRMSTDIRFSIRDLIVIPSAAVHMALAVSRHPPLGGPITNPSFHTSSKPPSPNCVASEPSKLHFSVQADNYPQHIFWTTWIWHLLH